MAKTPASLLERLRGPFDADAWTRFVALYTPLIFSWGRRVGLQEQDAGDLVQDVLTTLVQVLPTFAYDRHKSFRGWLRTVTLNQWRNKQKLWNEKLLRVSRDAVNQVAVAGELEAFWEAEYQQHLVSRALAVMRTDFEETTWLAFWGVVVEDQSAAAVAVKVGISVGAVYAAKFRVLDRLRQELRGLLD